LADQNAQSILQRAAKRVDAVSRGQLQDRVAQAKIARGYFCDAHTRIAKIGFVEHQQDLASGLLRRCEASVEKILVWCWDYGEHDDNEIDVRGEDLSSFPVATMEDGRSGFDCLDYTFVRTGRRDLDAITAGDTATSRAGYA
jgi:hypothetical protein